MTKDKSDEVQALISQMATVKDFKSPKIKYNLSKYNFGEIKPLPHRFFFFRKCGNNFIFFDYKVKKKRKLKDEVYKQINTRKLRYEEEFKKFLQT